MRDGCGSRGGDARWSGRRCQVPLVMLGEPCFRSCGRVSAASRSGRRGPLALGGNIRRVFFLLRIRSVKMNDYKGWPGCRWGQNFIDHFLQCLLPDVKLGLGAHGQCMQCIQSGRINRPSIICWQEHGGGRELSPPRNVAFNNIKSGQRTAACVLVVMIHQTQLHATKSWERGDLPGVPQLCRHP